MAPADPSDNRRFSLIVPAYNSGHTLASCLEALTNQSVPEEEYEVIVIDDGSTDNTSNIAKAFRVKYLHQTNRGPASARNRGSRSATGDIILFTDSDCVPDHDWIRAMVNPFQDPDVVGVKGAYKTSQKQLAARFAQAEFEDRYDFLQKEPSIDMVDTYSAAFRKDVFLEMNGFDESFPVANNEDTELSYRLASQGYKLVFNRRAFVYHTHPDTLVKYLKLKFWRGYWRMVVYRRYPDKAVKDSYTPAVIKLQTLLMGLALPLLCISWAIPWFIYPALSLLGIILISSLPFSLKTFGKDGMVGLVSPGIVLLRAASFAIGGFLGIVKERGHSSSTVIS